MAREKSRNILLVFSGSDWCAPCIKLQKEILETSEFQSFAEDHFVLLKADFPRKKANQLPAQQKEHNNKLAEKYNQNGYFPLVVMLDGNGRLLGETGYKNIPTDEYIAMLEEMEKE